MLIILISQVLSKWGVGVGRFEFEMRDTTVKLATGTNRVSSSEGSCPAATVVVNIASTAASLALASGNARRGAVEIVDINVSATTGQGSNVGPPASACSDVVQASVSRVSATAVRGAGEGVAGAADLVVVRPHLSFSLETVQLASDLTALFATRFRPVPQSRTEEGQDSGASAATAAGPVRASVPATSDVKTIPSSVKVGVTDASVAMCLRELSPAVSLSIESVGLEVERHRTEGGGGAAAAWERDGSAHEASGLGGLVSEAKGSVSQWSVFVHAAPDDGGSPSAPPVLRVAALDFIASDDNGHRGVALSMPQMETRHTVQQLDRIFELANATSRLIPPSAPASPRTPPAHRLNTETSAAKRARPPPSVSLDLGVARFVLTAPSTQTERAYTAPGDPAEACPATDYTIRLSTVKLTSGADSGGHPAFSATVASAMAACGPVEVITIAKLSVDLLRGNALESLRAQCAADESHPASPEAFEFGGGEGESARPRGKDAYWFTPVTSTSERLLHVTMARVDVAHPHDFNMGLYVDQLQNTWQTSLRLFRRRFGIVTGSEAAAAAGRPPPPGVMAEPGTDFVLANVLVSIEHIAFWIEDGPFETRLYLAHRLKAEEYDQQNARRLLLKSRVEQLRAEAAEEGKELDAEWVKAAFAELEVENSAIYCRRFRKIRPECGRSMLFRAEARGLSLGFVVDDRLQGDANVHATMRQLDPGGHVPDEFVSAFTFARRISFAAESVKVGVRQFPRNTLELNDFSITGVVILTSAFAWSDAHRQLARTVHVSGGWFSIPRDGMPMHVYHGFRVRSKGIKCVDTHFSFCDLSFAVVESIVRCNSAE